MHGKARDALKARSALKVSNLLLYTPPPKPVQDVYCNTDTQIPTPCIRPHFSRVIPYVRLTAMQTDHIHLIDMKLLQIQIADRLLAAEL